MKKYLTIDVGGTSTKYAVMSRAAKIFERGEFVTPKDTHENFLNAIVKLHKIYNDVEGIAISLPGIIDAEKGFCKASESIPHNNGHYIADELEKICGVKVAVENDANCAALAEVKKGNLADVQDSFVLVIGTQIGGTFIKNKKIHRGSHLTAGELSFLIKGIYYAPGKNNFCGNLTNAGTLQKIYAELKEIQPNQVNIKKFFEELEAEDEIAVEAMKRYAMIIGTLIYNLQLVLDVEKFAIGGGMSIQPKFIYYIQRRVNFIFNHPKTLIFTKPEIVPCKFFNDSNLIGALYNLL